MKTIGVYAVQEVYCHTTMEVTDEQYEELDGLIGDELIDALFKMGFSKGDLDEDEGGDIVRASIVDWDDDEEEIFFNCGTGNNLYEGVVYGRKDIAEQLRGYWDDQRRNLYITEDTYEMLCVAIDAGHFEEVINEEEAA